MKFSILKDVESFNDGFSSQKDISVSLGPFISLGLKNGVSEKIYITFFFAISKWVQRQMINKTSIKTKLISK